MNKPQHPIKIAFFDIDETLYAKYEGYLPPSIAEQVLPRLREKGIITAIASGRNPGGFPKAIKPLLEKNLFDLFVTINGQHNYYQGKIISEYTLTNERIDQMIAGFNKLSIPYAFVTPDDIAVSEVNDDVHGAVTPIKEDYAIDPHFHHKHKITQLLAFYPAELDQAVADSGLLGDDMKAVRWNRIGVDVLKKDNSKARGIHDVLEALNIGIENAIAFGDGLNDIEMFNSVGFAVAMGNGEDELKVLADFVTKSVKEDGILYALEQLEII